MNTNTGKSLKRIVALVLSLAVACPYAYAAEIGKATYVEGRVDLISQDTGVAKPIREGDSISVGDAVRTKSNAKAEFTFNDNSVLRIAQNSKVEVKDYVLDGNNRRKTANIMLDRGKARTIIAKMPDKAEFCISTPNSKGTVKGSDISFSYQAGSSNLLVAEGQLSILNTLHPEEKIIIPAGNSVIVPLDETPKGPREYSDLEKKMQEEETAVPANVVRRTDSTMIKGTFANMSGEVRIISKGTNKSWKASINDIVEEGDTIETGDNGIADIRFDNGNGLNLKPNTKITITKLVQDPNTGQYENKFDAAIGRVRARIENLNGKSTFEVRTPTAISGARGTIMYLDILPSVTKSYFEGGTGFITSLISGITKSIEAGQNASSDSNGNVTDPANTSQGERESFGEGWIAGNGTEGYSAPEGAGGIGVYGADTGIISVGTLTYGGTDGGLGQAFVNVPLTVGGPEDTTGQQELTGITLNGDIEGSFGGGSGGQPTETNFLSAVLTYDNANGSASLTGSYANDSGSKQWSSDVSQTSAEGGALVGKIDGTWHSWEGVMAGIFIDQLGVAGTVLGFLSGRTNEEGPGTFKGEGVLDITSHAGPETGFSAEDLMNPESGALSHDTGSGYLYIPFNNGYLDTGINTKFTSITGQNWGIWETGFAAEYVREEGVTSWAGMAGGHYSDGEQNYCYFMGAAIGTDDLAGGVRIELPFVAYLDTGYFGTFYGTILADYSLADTVSLGGTGLGVYGEEKLTFSGRWGGSGGGSLYYFNSGNFYQTGEEYGLIGSLTPSWWTSPQFETVAIGEYYDYNEGVSHLIWNTPLYSNAPENNSGGVFSGFTSGIWNNGKMDGSGVGIFLAPTGTYGIYDAGYFMGSISGDYYGDLGMWMSLGIFTPEIKESGIEISPENLGSFNERISRYIIPSIKLFGTFNGVGSIEGYLQNGEAYALSGSTWGIYDLKFGMGSEEYMSVYSNPNPETNKEWSAIMGGMDRSGDFDSYMIASVSGTWVDGEIRGSVNGRSISSEGYLGTYQGSFYGVSATDGDNSPWIGTSIGIWYDTPLSFWGNITGGFGYSDQEGSYFYSSKGSLSAIFGGIDPLWDSDTPVVMLGVYSNPDNAYKLFSANFTGRTSDNASLFGSVAGDWNNGNIRGKIVGLYVSPTQSGPYWEAGIFKGDASGEYMTELGMWVIDGAVTAEKRGISYSDPATASLYINKLGFYPEGSRDTGWVGNPGDDYFSGDLYYIDQYGGKRWGVWTNVMGGVYVAPETSTFRSSACSFVEPNPEAAPYGAILGTVTSTVENGEMAGVFNGITLLKNGTEGGITIGTMTGDVVGNYVDVVEATGTWQAAGAGEWVEVSDLLNETQMFGPEGLRALDSFVSVPITEVYSNMLTGAGTGGIASAGMNVNMYAISPTALNGIWASLISGTYSGAVSSKWTANLANGAGDNVALTGTHWQNNQWVADVTGTLNGNTITHGQAGGTYTAPDVSGNGAFTGVGVGTWQTPT